MSSISPARSTDATFPLAKRRATSTLSPKSQPAKVAETAEPKLRNLSPDEKTTLLIGLKNVYDAGNVGARAKVDALVEGNGFLSPEILEAAARHFSYPQLKGLIARHQANARKS